MNTGSLQALAFKFAEALNTKNVGLFDTFIAPDYIQHNLSVASGIGGREGVLHRLAGSLS